MIELRKEGGTAVISGVASKTGVWYPVEAFQERVAAGAFTATLRSAPDVLLTAEHDRSRAVARTPSTLSLKEDATGSLHYAGTVDLADGDARSIVSKVERGIYRESSFAFRVPEGGDSWSPDYSQRTVHRVDIDRGDVSVVPFGASPTTSASVQRAFAGSLDERRSIARTISGTGWCGPGLALRSAAYVPGGPSAEDDHAGRAVCISCAGRGRDNEGAACPDCGGTGYIDQDDDDDRAAPKYTAAQLREMMREGIAMPNHKGEPSFPCADRQDITRAVRAVGRGKRSSAAIRLHVMKNARRLNAMDLIPSSWAADGTTTAGRSAVMIPPAQYDEYEFEIERIKAGHTNRLSRTHRGPTSRDAQERAWQEARASRQRSEDAIREFLTERWRAR
ncbi:MAG: HK97 family phage prohead protease [Solirubrobacteraceae bacterium]